MYEIRKNSWYRIVPDEFLRARIARVGNSVQMNLHALVVGGEDEDGNQLNSAESICIELSQLRTADGPP